MRKILRTRLRHQAEKSNSKTIKVFRRLWKNYKDKRKPVVVTGTTTTPKKKKKQSMIHRAVNKLFRKKK